MGGKPQRGGTGARARAADDERASSWDKIRDQEVDQQSAYRDVYNQQQLDRSRIGAVRSPRRLRVMAGVLGLFVAAMAWLVASALQAAAGAVMAMLGLGRPSGGLSDAVVSAPPWKPGLSALAGLVVGLVVYMVLKRQQDAQNLKNSTADINQHLNDQHLMTPEETVRELDWFPDAGAHSHVSVTIPLSHAMLSNKGLRKVRVTRRAKEDVLDADGNVVVAAGEALYGDDGEPLTDLAPMIDEAFGEDLWTASDIPLGADGRKMRLRFDASAVPYNPGGRDRDKLKYETAADLVNGDWFLPGYETQRPAGAYLVSTAPANTFLLGITRSKKGQTVIESTVDMWSREAVPQNMVVNDPKGELLLKNYVAFTRRGYRVAQFNLMNPMKTDIYNPLVLASEAMREGDVVKCMNYVESLADVFFPKDSGDDPFWANAANNAFKRVAFGMIDYAMEEERGLRARAEAESMPAKLLAQRVDELWGKVTLYNCYQFFTVLSSKKRKAPTAQLKERVAAGEFGDVEDSDNPGYKKFLQAKEQAEREAVLWNSQPEVDLLSLYFAATELLPQNGIRTMVANANNALKSMGGAEKTISTVYGIAITAMSFFTDQTIMRLTSGAPSQNVDLGGLSFPRRLGVRFDPEYLAKERLVGTLAVWSAYGDAEFTRPLGEAFGHTDTVSTEGWARYYFEGKFPGQTGYVKLEVRNSTTDMLIRTFRFRFDKGWQTSLDGRVYVTDPVTGEKIVLNGVLVELRQDASGAWRTGNSTFDRPTLVFDGDGGEPAVRPVPTRVFAQASVRYSERPFAVFLVQPPHMLSYAKLLLILIKQMVDLNFDRSYLTKSNQKPLYKTRFMLDELGNLQSEGHGIAGLQTMFSIGLGQEQQFVGVLQTLQQLRDVYGDSVDKVLSGNVLNLILLASNDTTMLEELEKLSGTRHVSYTDSKTVTENAEALIKSLNVEGKVSYTTTTVKEPVIQVNDMLFIGENQSMVFRIRKNPIWNRRHMILPMSYRLFDQTIKVPGRKYTQQTLPTLSTVTDYDPRRNLPDFFAMLERRKAQALEAAEATEAYRKAFGLTELEMSRLDPEVTSDAIMSLIDRRLNAASRASDDGSVDLDEFYAEMAAAEARFYEDNDEVLEAADEAGGRQAERDEKRYAMGTLSRSEVNAAISLELAMAYEQCSARLWSDPRFRMGPGGGLQAADGTALVEPAGEGLAEALQAASDDPGSTVYSEAGAVEQAARLSWRIDDAFYALLRRMDSWESLAGGDFDRTVGQLVRARGE